MPQKDTENKIRTLQLELFEKERIYSIRMTKNAEFEEMKKLYLEIKAIRIQLISLKELITISNKSFG